MRQLNREKSAKWQQTDAQKQLCQRLQAFSFDQPDTQLLFSQRLAKENGWSLIYAQRVIEEYKRFAFLAVVAGHPVSPSEQVDQVWHLHLTYTRSYWQEFCPAVLQMPLHHEPTRGGSAERLKFHDWYGETLKSYQSFWGERPPTDIWLPPEIRFGQDLHFVRVNTQRNWVIPKISLKLLPEVRWNRAGIGVLLFALTVGITGCQAIAGFNPLNLPGAEFLFFYCVVAIVALMMASRLRTYLRLPDGDPVQRPVRLNIYETAYLAGDRQRVVDTAITALVQQENLTVLAKQRYLVLKNPLEKTADAVEQAVVAAVQKDRRINQVRQVALPATDGIRDRLQQLDLLVSRGQSFKAQLFPALILFALLALALSKMAIGISRDKPTGYLSVLCLLTAIAGVAFLLTPARRSRYGDRVFTWLQNRAPSSDSPPHKNPNTQLLLTFALFGATALSGSALTDLQTVFTLPSGSGGDGEGGGDGGCGGGCGGCGGCGG